MAERVGGASAWNADHSAVRRPGVVNDDLRLFRVAVPLQGDRETVILAGVEFNKHSAGLSGVGLAPVAGESRSVIAGPGVEFDSGGNTDWRMTLPRRLPHIL